jgi:hypothetical protein
MHKFNRRLRRFALSLGVCLFLTQAAPVQAASGPDEAARLLAGMQLPASSSLEPLTHSVHWQRHARYFDSAWSHLDRRQLSRVRAWSEENLKTPRPSNLFYMFSGPDFLYADAFFPDASVYVLSGLEPVGNVPELSELSSRSFSAGLYGLESSLRTVLNYSFFITREMRSTLQASRLTGALPVLYVFLARADKTIRETTFITLDAEGAVRPESGAPSREDIKGVMIVFSGRDGRERTLYYFSTDLSNDGVRKSGFLKFCEKLGAGAGLIKSASYLLHSDEFSSVRQFLLDHLQVLVQDDSGVPARFFKSEEWELHPFGHYITPISLFSQYSQAKLREVYRREHAAPLRFGVGYRWRDPNLLLARKKDGGQQASQ